MRSLKDSIPLHLGATAATYANAKGLRQSQTLAEQKLWSFLRNRQLKGMKIRRQHAVGNYVLDFYCHESKIAIELDGNVHKTSVAKEYDDTRTMFLKDYGITVLRFWNAEVMTTSTVCLQLSVPTADIIHTTPSGSPREPSENRKHHHPSPLGEGTQSLQL
jgi:very-short-patch-repair endonuclease